jgi:hypothetical protein
MHWIFDFAGPLAETPVKPYYPHTATVQALHGMGLGCSPFARRYSGNLG